MPVCRLTRVFHARVAVALFFCALRTVAQSPANATNGFVNFETASVHPIALSPDRRVLAVCNLADGKLELFDAGSTNLIAMAAIAAGVDPVSVRFLDDNEAWVAHYLSDSISVVDVPSRRVRATIDTLQNPADVVFAGTPR